VNFLYPTFLIAGAVLAIPIIIHLFNFRKFKKVFFSDIRFLQEVKEQTNKRAKLKHLLVLSSRLLALLALVFAFCQPFFGDASLMSKGAKCTSIYIDNSYSMGIQQNGIPLLELAKNKAKEVVNNSSNADVFEIISNEFSPTENKLVNKEQAIANINAMQISAQTRDIASVLQKQKASLSTSSASRKQIIYISDFQKNKHAFPVNITDDTRKFLIPVQAEKTNNVSIDSAYFSSPTIQLNTNNDLMVRVHNYDAENSATLSLSLNANEQIKSVKNIDLKPNESRLETIPYSTTQAGWQKLKLYITDYPVSFDDTFYLAGNVNANFNVLLVNDNASNPYLNAVFRVANSFRCDNINADNIKKDGFKNYSLVVLSNINSISDFLQTEIDAYVNKGGSVLIFPSNSMNITAINNAISGLTGCMYNTLDTSKMVVSSIQKENQIIKDLFDKIPDNVELPIASKHYPIRSSTFSNEQKIFSFANGDAFLSSYTKGNGKIYLCASAADANSSNFTNSYWFLPILFKMAYLGKNEPIHAYTLGKDAIMNIPNTKAGDNNVFHLTADGWDAIPEQRNIGAGLQINLNNAAKFAGLYNLSLPGNNVENTFYAGLNYNRSESNLAHWIAAEVKSKSGLKNTEVISTSTNLAAAIGQMQVGTPIWKICLAVALLMLLIEVLLIRFF
jgi:Aerotolerance regulator N-terminal